MQARALPSIGLVIEAVDDPFYARLTSGVEQVARERDHFVVVSSSQEDPALEREIVLGLWARQVSGLIVVPCSEDHRYLEPLITAGIAVVFVDRPPRGLDADCVLTDNVGGAFECVSELLMRGHRRIAFIGMDASVYTARERLAGYRAAHAEAGVDVEESLVAVGPRTALEAHRAAWKLLSRPDPPDAIFAMNNPLTVGSWRAVHDAGATVAVGGFDDFEFADVLVPPVTVVAQDPAALGRRAAELLYDRIARPHDPVRQIVLATHLRGAT